MTYIPESSHLVFVAVQAALRAGNLLRKGFGSHFTVSTKTNAQDLVTSFDKAAEEVIIDLISTQFPDHSFLAEESGATRNEDALVRWIIDPLDGTMNFAHHIPIFVVSIAAFVQHHVEAAVLYQPMTEELFIAQRGHGAYLNGVRLAVSNVSDIQFAIGATGFPYGHSNEREACEKQFIQCIKNANPVRIIGSAALNLGYVAAGRFDMCWGANLKPWDVAAGKLLVEEAGGKITHYHGGHHDMFHSHTLLASNGLLHDYMQAILQ